VQHTHCLKTPDPTSMTKMDSYNNCCLLKATLHIMSAGVFVMGSTCSN